MPTFVFTDPSGAEHEVTGPEGATQEQAFSILQQQLKSSAPKPPAAKPFIKTFPDKSAITFGESAPMEGSFGAGVGAPGKWMDISRDYMKVPPKGPRLPGTGGGALPESPAEPQEAAVGRRLGPFPPTEPRPFQNPALEIARKATQFYEESAGNLPAFGDMLLGMGSLAVKVGARNAMQMRAEFIYNLDHKTANAVADKFAEEVSDNNVFAAQPLRRLMAAFGKGEAYDKSHISQAMAWLMEHQEALEKGIETKTGVVTASDARAIIEAAMLTLGAAGLKAMRAKKRGETRGESTLEGLNADVAGFQEGVKAGSPEDLYTKAAGETPEGGVPKRDVKADVERTTGITRDPYWANAGKKGAKKSAPRTAAQAEADMRAAISEDPAWAQQLEAIAEGEALQRAAAAERARSLAEDLPPSGERTRGPERIGGVELEVGPKESLKLVEESDTLLRASRKLRRLGPWSLTAEERIALQGAASRWNNPEILKGLAAVGIVGGTALALGADPEEVALAAGMVGIPLSRRRKAVTDLLPEMSKVLDEAESFGPSSLPKLDQVRMGLVEKGTPPAALAAFDDYVRGMEKLSEPLELPGFIFPVSHDPTEALASLAVLPLAAIVRANPATPLREFAPRLRYTTRVLEMMTKELGDRATFSAAQVKGFLGRQGIAGAEREMFEGIMRGKEEISARDLVAGVKEATGDFELKAKGTDEFADYGLASIDRIEPSNRDLLDPIPDVWAGTTPTELTATTRIYQSPIELGTNNHFRDPNYFAHTRSFVEDGVSHVVEVQSDLAQKAGKRLSEFEKDDLRTKIADITSKESELSLLESEARVPSKAFEVLQKLREFPEFETPLRRGENNPEFMLNRELRRLEALRAEYRAKLREADVDPIRPILKDWWKRIIREEVAETRAADPNAKVVRFATADTVAKVEGWPETVTYREGATTFDERHTRFRRVGNITLSDGRSVFGDYKLTGNLRVKNGRVEAELQGPQAALRGSMETVWAPEGTVRFAHNGDTAKALGAKSSLLPKHQGIYDRYRKDIESYLRKEFSARDYTDPKGHTWLEVDLPPDATPIRLWSMGAAAAGAALTAMWLDGGDESTAALAALAATPVPKRGLVRRALGPAVVIGGSAALANAAFDKEGEFYYAGGAAVLAGLAAFAHHRSPQIRSYVEQTGLAAEVIYGNMSTMLKGISPATLRRVRDFEWQNMVHRYESLKLIDKAVDGLLKLPRNVRDAVDIALFNNERAVALKLIPTKLAGELKTAFEFLDREGAEMLRMGLVKKLDPEYWPRVVKDLDGLFAQLEKISGKKAKDFLEEKLREASGAKAKKTGDALNDMEISSIINEHLQAAINRPDQPGQAGMLKKRTIKEVRQDILPFYETAADSIAIYAKAAAKEIERAKFFGKDLVKAKGSNAVLLDASIGRVVKAERDAGRLTDKQLSRLEMILKARFGPGERSGNALSRTYRNVVQALLLGNPYSALVQFGDLGTSIVVHGVKSTVVGVIKTLSGSKNKWSLDEVGLADHVLNDFDVGVHKPLR